jgi:hypothetical protein
VGVIHQYLFSKNWLFSITSIEIYIIVYGSSVYFFTIAGPSESARSDQPGYLRLSDRAKRALSPSRGLQGTVSRDIFWQFSIFTLRQTTISCYPVGLVFIVPNAAIFKMKIGHFTVPLNLVDDYLCDLASSKQILRAITDHATRKVYR